MRYFVISDIHANLEALDAVLAAVPRSSYDRLLVLGDLVGYGADPNAVVDRMRELVPHSLIRGNHDKVAAGIDDAEGFNFIAQEAALWTQRVLSAENRQYLYELPAGPQVVDELVEVCHGSPFDEDAYIFDRADAIRAFETISRPVGFFGHTHLAVIFRLCQEALEPVLPDESGATRLSLRNGCRYLINPGSVGQPRDADPRAAYAMLDTVEREVGLYRVEYAIDRAQAKITAAGLPEPLAQRLRMGR